MQIQIEPPGKLVEYEAAQHTMETRVAQLKLATAEEKLWLLEHPPLYTAGRSAKSQDLLTDPDWPVYETGRGGQYTYHGPGQRIGYVILDLRRHHTGKPDIRRFVHSLEQWLIDTLADFNIIGERREGRVGIWTIDSNGRECKIAAIGVRMQQWISSHGIALNISPDLSHYQGIIPCGITDYGVTSMKALGCNATMQDVDPILVKHFHRHFTP